MFREKSDGPRHSGSWAKRRIGDLMLSERLACSPQMIETLKHETIRTIRKFISIEEQAAVFEIAEEPPVLHIRIPLTKKRVEKDAKTI